MITNADKAFVALVMAVVQTANVFGFHWGITQDEVTEIVSLVTPILIYFIPNKGA